MNPSLYEGQWPEARQRERSIHPLPDSNESFARASFNIPLYLPRTLRSICIVKFPIYAKVFSYWGVLTMEAWSLLASITRERPNQWASSWRIFLNAIWAVLVQVVNAFNLPRKAIYKKLSSTCIVPWQARSQWSQFPRVHWVVSLGSFGSLPG